MTKSPSMLSQMRSFYSNLPRIIKWPVTFSVVMPLLSLYIPLSILMSQSMYIATFDLSIVSILVVNQIINQSFNQPVVVVGLGLIAQSSLRWFLLNIIKSTSHSRSINQSNLIAIGLLALPFLQLLIFVLLKFHQPSDSTANRYPFQLFIIPFILSFLVSLSVIWVPTSHELAYQAETDLLKETGLIEHVVRGKAASLRYFLLDHPINQSNVEHSHTSVVDDLIDQSINQSKRPSLVCLHGYGAAGLFYAHSMSRWSHTADVYSVDLLGFGLSSHDPFTATTPVEAENHFVDSLERWRQVMNIDKMILLGHSFGGLVSAAYALKYPEHTHAILLASPVGIPNPPEDMSRVGPARLGRIRPLLVWLWQLGLTPASGLHFMGPLGPSLVNLVISKRFGQLDHVASRPSFARYMYHINAHQGSGLATLNSLIAPGAYARLPLGDRMKDDMQVPTYFIFGESDWMYNPVTPDVVKAIRERGVHASLERVSKSGHQVSFENTKEFETIVHNKIQHVLELDLKR